MKNKAVEKAYRKLKQGEELVEEQKTADRCIYWYVLALSLSVLLSLIEPLVRAWL